MSHKLFRRLGPSTRLALAVLVVGSFAVVMLLPPVIPVAETMSCPPGWESCTTPVPNGECCAPIGILWRTLAKTCTVWDHDVNSYPTCTYKVVQTYVVKSCDWWDAC